MAWSLETLLAWLQRFCIDESISKADLIRFIELRYDRIYNYTLDFYKTEGTFSLVSGTKYYYMARQLNLAIRPKFFNQTNGNKEIDVVEYDHILKIDSDQSETGAPWKVAFVELSPVRRQPNESSDDGTVKVKSSSASDTSQKVTLTGLATINSQQVEVTEELTLTGTTTVTSSYTWHTFYSVSKSADTVGFVSVTDSGETNIYSLIDPYRSHSDYQKWRMWPTPDVTDTIRYTGYRRAVVPQNNSAIIDVSPDLEAGFIQGLRADVHDANFDMGKAQKFEAMFEEAVKRARENNMWDDQDIVIGSESHRRYDPRSNLEPVSEDIEVV